MIVQREQNWLFWRKEDQSSPDRVICISVDKEYAELLSVLTLRAGKGVPWKHKYHLTDSKVEPPSGGEINSAGQVT